MLPIVRRSDTESAWASDCVARQSKSRMPNFAKSMMRRLNKKMRHDDGPKSWGEPPKRSRQHRPEIWDR